MKKIVSTVIVGFLLISGFGAVAFPDETRQEKMTIHFSKLIINENSNFVTLELEGTNSILMKYNHYMVPTRIVTFTFPFGTQIKSINCIPRNIHRQTITQELMVSPEPVLLEYTNIQKNIKTDSHPIAPTGWYDYNIGTGIQNNNRNVIVKVQMFPVQYQPLINSIEWAEEIEIEIQYKEPEKPIVSANEYNFLVLSPDEYANELEDLVAHKNNRGLKTKLVTLDEIYQSQYFPVEGRDDPEKVKYFIKNSIEQWGINSVLLVGGDQAFPARKAHPYNVFVSDLYYADVYNANGSFCSWDTNEDDRFGEYNKDEVDIHPDVYLGRLACVNKDEALACVQKIINYEITKGYSQDWFNKLVVVAGDCFPNDGISEGESATQVAIDKMDGFVPDEIWASNGRLSGNNPTGVDEINNAVNTGCGFFYFSGHSSPTEFFTFPLNDSRTRLPTPTGYYSNDHISDLSNNDKLPIVVFDSCSPCKYNTNEDCIGWSFVSNPEGGGIGFFGATTSSLCYRGEDFTQGLAIKLALNVFETYNNTDTLTLGELWNKAIVNYIFPDMAVADYITLEQWQPFIDPTLTIKEISQAPEKPQKPDGPSSGGTGVEYAYTTSTTDPDGDQVYYLFDWGDGKFSEYIGPYNPGGTVEASHKWDKKGDYQVRVKAKDEHGVQSEWSDPLPVIMPKNRALENINFLRLFDCLTSRFPVLNFLTNSLELKV